MLMLETGGGSDYFISFNHARGVNSEVQQAQNQVTVYQVDSGDGMSYSKSMLKIALRSGRSATIENWRRTGKDLTIKVNTISTWSSPGYADVQVSFG
jgi:FlaG/FlaF family flagellin (archaellin)